MLSFTDKRLLLVPAFLAMVVTSAPAPAYDCNRNGIEDHVEVTSGTSPDCNGNGIPDGCDIAPVNFGLASRGSLFVGSGPVAVAPADLDGDGDIDLAGAVLVNGGGVTVLWNSGTGSILATTEHPASVQALAIQAGDIDGDRRLDLAVAATSRVTLLLQRGLRRFSPTTVDLASATHVQSLILADFDGDGDLDIACIATFEAIILKNGGGGAFTSPPESIPIGSNPVGLAVARIDGDDRLDIVTVNRLPAPVPSGNISVLLNRGDGSFHAPRNFGVGTGPASIATGDLDGDGKTDVLTANADDGDFSILPGRGDGTFGVPRRIATEGPPLFVALADIDVDGDLDIVSLRQDALGGAVMVAFNHLGEFVEPIDFSVPFVSQLAVQDMTGDGRLDVVAVEPPTSLLLLEGILVEYDTDCNGSRIPDGCEIEANDCNGNRLPDDCDLRSGESVDCDRDGVPDECQPDCNGNGAADSCDIDQGTSADCNRNSVPDECDVLSTELSFDGTAIPYGGEQISIIETADLDADGHEDIYGARFSTGLSVLWNHGRGFRDPPVNILTPFPTQAVDAGDLDRDGDVDLVAGDLPGTRVLIVINDGDRSFRVRDRIPVGKVPTGLVVGDLDVDGDEDLAVLEAESGNLVGISNDGNGTFAAPVVIGQGPGIPFHLAEVDGDGRPDLIATDVRTNSPAVFWNEAGRFPGRTPLGGNTIPPSQMTAADLDKDGDVDVAIAVFEAITVARQSRPRAFTSFLIRTDVAALIGIAAADWDRDGDVDLAAGALKEVNGSIGIFLNSGNASSFEGPLFVGGGLVGGGGFIPSLTTGDYDGDGGPDLACSVQPQCIDFCEPFPHFVVLRNQTLSATSPDLNHNGRPDECDPGAFRRGDSDGDGSVSLADAVFTLRGLFQGGPQPGCAESADADNDGSVDVADPVSVLEFLFRGGPPPAAPGPPPGPCGLDTDLPGSPADLGCAAYASC